MLIHITQLIDLRYKIIALLKKEPITTYVNLFQLVKSTYITGPWSPTKNDLVNAINELHSYGLVNVEGLDAGTFHRIQNEEDFEKVSALKITF